MAKRNARKHPAKRRTAATPRKSARSQPSRRRATAARRKKTAQKKRRPKARRATRRASPARAKKAAAKLRAPARRKAPAHTPPPRLARERRLLAEDNVPTPPSSLNMDRHGSAARTGRAEMAQSRANHASMSPAIAAGDADVNLENAYFSGDEAPGGDNPTPDQDVVDEIGQALGVVYQDSEELRASDKVADRDKHRWELDPASAEDYKER